MNGALPERPASTPIQVLHFLEVIFFSTSGGACMIQRLFYANVLAFKRRVRDGEFREQPDLKVQPYPIVSRVSFPYRRYINIAN